MAKVENRSQEFSSRVNLTEDSVNFVEVDSEVIKVRLVYRSFLNLEVLFLNQCQFLSLVILGPHATLCLHHARPVALHVDELLFDDRHSLQVRLHLLIGVVDTSVELQLRQLQALVVLFVV